MHFLTIIGGIVSLALGVVLCIPVGYIGWLRISVPKGTSGNVHLHVSFLRLKLTGWQVWAFVSGVAVVGALLLLLGFYALLLRNSGS
jgi:hypothetical protein